MADTDCQMVVSPMMQGQIPYTCKNATGLMKFGHQHRSKVAIMRILNLQEIHAVSGSATATAMPKQTNPFTYLFMGVFWGLAGLLGFSVIDFI